MRKIKLVLFVSLVFFLIAFLFGCGKSIIDDSTEKDTGADTPKINVSVDILKVGKADCIVINTGTKIVMIDTGEEENVPYINSFMEKKGYKKIDVLIISHYDKDHLGGALQIIPKYNVSTVIESALTTKSDLYKRYQGVLESCGVSPLKLKENHTLELDECKIEIDVPPHKKYSENHDNNSSLVVSLICNERKLLFCGDAMELRLDELIEKGIGKYDFIKLPHHGTYIENYMEFLNMTSPTYAAITCSNKNPPSDETLALLLGLGVKVFETRNGDVHIFTNGKALTVSN